MLGEKNSGAREKNSLLLPSYYSCVESCRFAMAINYHTIILISATFCRFCRLRQRLPQASAFLDNAAHLRETKMCVVIEGYEAKRRSGAISSAKIGILWKSGALNVVSTNPSSNGWHRQKFVVGAHTHQRSIPKIVPIQMH